MAKTPGTKVVTKKHLARLEREKRQNKIIVTASIVVIALVVLLIGYGYLNENVIKYSRPVAKVGSDTITLGEFQTQVRFTRYQLIQQYNQTAQLSQMFGNDESYASYFTQSLTEIETKLNDSAVLGSEVLDSLIQSRIIRQEADRLGITVTQAEIDQALESFFGYTPNGTATPEVVPTTAPTSTLSALQMTLVPPTATATVTPTLDVTETATPDLPTETATPETVDTATPEAEPTISPTETPYTAELYKTNMDTYLDSIKDTKVDEAYLRQLLENNLYYDRVRAALTADLKPEQEQVWARHILVADEATANTVIEKLNQGEDFAALAAEYSTDTTNKDTGGDLGWFAAGTMVKEFDDAVFALDVGEISGPVVTGFGVHVIQVLGHEVRPLDASTLDTMRDTQMQEWLTGEMAKDTVVKYDTWEDQVPTEPQLTNLVAQ